MPRRMSTERVQLAYSHVTLRDGEKCSRCGWEYGQPLTRIQRSNLFGDASLLSRRERIALTEKLQRLELNHVDGNPFNNPEDGSNWNLLCKTCNLPGGIQGGGGREGESQSEREKSMRIGVKRLGEAERMERGRNTRLVKKAANYLGGESTMKANAICEPVFRDYCLTRILRQGQVRWDTLCDSGAEVSGCHPAKTAPYYLKKMTSDEGVLKVIELNGERWVILRERPAKMRGRKAAGA